MFPSFIPCNRGAAIAFLASAVNIGAVRVAKG